MRTEEKTAVKNSVGRMMFVGISVLIQAVWILFQFKKLNEYSTFIALLSSVLALVVVLKIYGGTGSTAFKMPWIMLILAFPVMGLCLYFMVGHTNVLKSMRKRIQAVNEKFVGKLKQDEQVLADLRKKDLAIANQASYIWKYGQYPMHNDTDIEFYSEAEDGLAAQKEALLKAEKFIFMEYHAIEDSVAFDGIRKILVQKAKEGVEVRVFYDDVGSVGFINMEFVKRMEKDGIQCRVFNPLIPILHVFMNNRDHRKVTVIDGKVGFTGGYNLADEYFNITHPYGQWKDTGVRMEGEAVRNLTVMFLELWNAIDHTDTDFEKYLEPVEYQPKENAYVQPFGDSPMDDEPVGENVYMNIVKNAKDYVYFTTPYLIITDEFKRELCMAAKRGVDVRIITPGIPDKKVVYQLTRSYYAGLAKEGVRIYEYTPGFLHAKQCVCDGETAVCGTINLDYRSLYLHFENGVFFYNCKAVGDMRKDFDNLFPICREVTEQYRSGRSAAVRIGQCILRLFAPLM